MDDKGEPLHDEPPRPVSLKWVTVRIGLDRLNRLARRALELQTQPSLSALVEGD